MQNEKPHRRIRILPLVLLFLSLVLIGAGILLGNPLDIYRKAVFICMECIGLG